MFHLMFMASNGDIYTLCPLLIGEVVLTTEAYEILCEDLKPSYQDLLSLCENGKSKRSKRDIINVKFSSADISKL